MAVARGGVNRWKPVTMTVRLILLCAAATRAAREGRFPDPADRDAARTLIELTERLGSDGE